MPPARYLARPRILIVVPGHGSSDRTSVLVENLQHIAFMAVDTTCLLYVYVGEDKLSTAWLTARLPQCRIVRQAGFWLKHWTSTTTLQLAASHDYVLMMIDSVHMRYDVDLLMLSHIMQQNCLHRWTPACSTCLTKRTINHDWSREVGRIVPAVDPQVTMFTRAAYLCHRKVVEEIIGYDNDPWGWSAAYMFPTFCSSVSRVGIIDAMSIDKVWTSSGVSGSTYNW